MFYLEGKKKEHIMSDLRDVYKYLNKRYGVPNPYASKPNEYQISSQASTRQLYGVSSPFRQPNKPDKSQATSPSLAFYYNKKEYAQYLRAKSSGMTVEQLFGKTKTYKEPAAVEFSKPATYAEWQAFLSSQLNNSGSNSYRAAYVSVFGAYPEMHGASPSKAALDILIAVQSGQMINNPAVIRNHLKTAYPGITEADIQKIMDFTNKASTINTQFK